ncbi:MAG TPA: hypothetical protein VG796_16255 [Verrucomicrobiales bacterium]|nr:hypothetical protein [Verrucomicrobiales bacterium]
MSTFGANNEQVCDDPDQAVTSKRWTKVERLWRSRVAFARAKENKSEWPNGTHHSTFAPRAFEAIPQNGTSAACFGSGSAGWGYNRRDTIAKYTLTHPNASPH